MNCRRFITSAPGHFQSVGDKIHFHVFASVHDQPHPQQKNWWPRSEKALTLENETQSASERELIWKVICYDRHRFNELTFCNNKNCRVRMFESVSGLKNLCDLGLFEKNTRLGWDPFHEQGLVKNGEDNKQVWEKFGKLDDGMILMKIVLSQKKLLPIFLHTYDKKYLIGLTPHHSGSQPGCRGTQGCHELVQGVPPIVKIPWSLYLRNQPGVPPNIFNTK